MGGFRERSPMGWAPHAPPASSAAVKIVADDRMSASREVDTNLVRAAGLRKEPKIRDTGQPREGFVSGDRPLSVRPDLHLSSVARIAAERLLDPARRRSRSAPHQSA